MELLPDELVCHILSYVTHWDDIMAVMHASWRFQQLARCGIRQIKTASSRVIRVNDLNGLLQLRHLDVLVLIETVGDLSRLLNYVHVTHLRIQVDIELCRHMKIIQVYSRPLIDFVSFFHATRSTYSLDVCEYHGHTIITRDTNQMTLQTNLISDLPRDVLSRLPVETLIYTDYASLRYHNPLSVQRLVLFYNNNGQAIKETIDHVTAAWPHLISIRLHLDHSGSPSAKANIAWRLIGNWSFNLTTNSKIIEFDVPVNPSNLKTLRCRLPLVEGWTLILENLADLDDLDNNLTYTILVPMAFVGKTLPERANVSYKFIE
jgi:hypothetical protein